MNVCVSSATVRAIPLIVDEGVTPFVILGRESRTSVTSSLSLRKVHGINERC